MYIKEEIFVTADENDHLDLDHMQIAITSTSKLPYHESRRAPSPNNIRLSRAYYYMTPNFSIYNGKMPF